MATAQVWCYGGALTVCMEYMEDAIYSRENMATVQVWCYRGALTVCILDMEAAKLLLSRAALMAFLVYKEGVTYSRDEYFNCQGVVIR